MNKRKIGKWEGTYVCPSINRMKVAPASAFMVWKIKFNVYFAWNPRICIFTWIFSPFSPFLFFFFLKRSVLVLYCVLCWQKKAFFYISEKIPERKKVLSRHFSHDPLFPRAQTLTQLSPQKKFSLTRFFFIFICCWLFGVKREMISEKVQQQRQYNKKRTLKIRTPTQTTSNYSLFELTTK